MLQRSWWSVFPAGCALRSGLKFGDIFLAITSSACAILESSARSLSTLIFVMILERNAHHFPRPYDEPLWRMADEVERIAGN